MWRGNPVSRKTPKLIYLPETIIGLKERPTYPHLTHLSNPSSIDGFIIPKIKPPPKMNDISHFRWRIISHVVHHYRYCYQQWKTHELYIVSKRLTKYINFSNLEMSLDYIFDSMSFNSNWILIQTDVMRTRIHLYEGKILRRTSSTQ